MEVEQEWVPYSTSASLYIRPTLIGTEVCNTLFFSPLFCLLRYEAKSSSIKGNIQQSVGDGINFGGGLVSWFLAVVLQHEFSVDHIAT